MSFWEIIAACLIPNIGCWINFIALSSKFQEKKGTLSPGIVEPSWSPPDYIIGPIWTYLYTSMGYASYLVWRDGGGIHGVAKFPLSIFAVQLVINWLYPPICFGAQSIKWGFIDLAVLTMLVGICGVMFYKINSVAGYLFLPYMAWLSFATTLNYCIWKDNPELSLRWFE